MQAAGARGALQEIGDVLRLHRQQGRELVHPRRPPVFSFQQRRGLVPQRFVLRRELGPMPGQVQAGACAQQASCLHQLIDDCAERLLQLGGSRADGIRLRDMPVRHRALERVAALFPLARAHHMPRAPHLERRELARRFDALQFRSRQVPAAREPVRVHHAGRGVEQGVEGFVRRAPRDRFQNFHALRARRAALRRHRVHHRAGGDQAPGTRIAQQQPVAMPGRDVAREAEARETRKFLQARGQQRGAQVPVHRPVAQRRAVECFGQDVDLPGARRVRRVCNGVAAFHVAPRQPVQRERAALAGAGALGLAVVRAQAAHARAPARGQHLHVVAHRDGARERSAGDHQAKSVDDERPVHVHAKALRQAARRDVPGLRGEPRAQRLHAGAGRRGNREDLGAAEPSTGEQRLRFAAGLGDALGRYAVDLGEHREQPRRAKPVEDLEMLARLRHRAVVGRHHQQREVDAAHARRHVAHEALVARNVDERDRIAALERQVGETQIDGHAAALFLRQAVGVLAGECAHQGSLAVVDVAGGGDDHRL
ncbi:MAG: hypothetical protein O2979_10050 [Proteobacteria bacterium]|nr:hypothetical protein [Pseudomonadota bacterium]